MQPFRLPYRCGGTCPRGREGIGHQAIAGQCPGRVRDAIEEHVRHEPTKTSRSRIKRLRGIGRPQYRLRVGEVRVFYDVSGSDVEILAIVPKSEANAWLAQFASPE